MSHAQRIFSLLQNFGLALRSQDCEVVYCLAGAPPLDCFELDNLFDRLALQAALIESAVRLRAWHSLALHAFSRACLFLTGCWRWPRFEKHPGSASGLSEEEHRMIILLVARQSPVAWM